MAGIPEDRERLNPWKQGRDPEAAQEEDDSGFTPTLADAATALEVGPLAKESDESRAGLKKRVRPLDSDPENWEDDDYRELFRLIGRHLEVGSTLSDAVYLAAKEIVGPGEPATKLGTAILNDDSFRNQAYEYVAGTPVWMSWDGPPGGADGLEVLDFGTGTLFACLPPDADEGRHWWLAVGSFAKGDQVGLRRVILDYLAEGRISQYLCVDAAVPRHEVHTALRDALDSEVNSNWESLEMMMEYGVDFDIDISTREGRDALLSAYLDEALEQ